MIEAHGPVKRYGSTMAVNDLSFCIRPGVVTGFLAPERRREARAGVVTLVLQVEERAQDAPDGGQLTGGDGAETVV